jgi:hypothetical protein
MSITTTTTVKMSISLIDQILLMVERNIFDNALWNRILSEMLTDNERIKYKIMLNILKSDVGYNVESFVRSFGPTITSLIGAIQVLFAKINVEEMQQKLLEWMESDNENEGQYLASADIVKNVNTAIEAFNYRSKQIKTIRLCRFYLHPENDALMVACEF